MLVLCSDGVDLCLSEDEKRKEVRLKRHGEYVMLIAHLCSCDCDYSRYEWLGRKHKVSSSASRFSRYAEEKRGIRSEISGIEG